MRARIAVRGGLAREGKTGETEVRPEEDPPWNLERAKHGLTTDSSSSSVDRRSMRTNVEISNAATLRILVRLHAHRPSPADVWWGSIIDSEMERTFATYDDDALRLIVSDTIWRLHEAELVSGALTTYRNASRSYHRIHTATLSNRAFQALELVDGDCGGIVADQAEIALSAADSRAIRVIGERLAGFLSV